MLGGVKLPPVNQFEWVIPVVLAVAMGAGVVEFMRVGRGLRRVGGAIAFGALAWLLVRSQAPTGLIVGLAAIGVVWWVSWDELVRRSPGGWAGMVMTGVAGCTSLVLMLSDSQRFGQMGLAMTGVMAAVWGIGWWFKWDVWRGAGVVWAVVVFGLVLNGKYWATPGLPWVNAGLLVGAPLLAWVGEVPVVKRLGGWRSGAVRVAAVVIPMAVAVVLAVMEFKRADASSGSEYY